MQHCSTCPMGCLFFCFFFFAVIALTIADPKANTDVHNMVKKKVGGRGYVGNHCMIFGKLLKRNELTTAAHIQFRKRHTQVFEKKKKKKKKHLCTCSQFPYFHTCKSIKTSQKQMCFWKIAMKKRDKYRCICVTTEHNPTINCRSEKINGVILQPFLSLH